MSTLDDEKNPIDQALDVLVYLPLGLVLDFPRSVPRYIDRGREQFDVARRIGRQAIGRPPTVSLRQIDRLNAHTRHTLRALGVATDTARSTSGNGSDPEPGPTGPNVTGARAGEDQKPTAPVPAPAVRAPSGIDPESLAITGYDSLSASQVVPRLDSLASDELEQVRLYEQGARGRKTILSKIAQLQAT